VGRVKERPPGRAEKKLSAEREGSPINQRKTRDKLDFLLMSGEWTGGRVSAHDFFNRRVPSSDNKKKLRKGRADPQPVT